MLGVCFHFETNDVNIYSGREIDLQMWRESLQILGVDTFIMVNTSSSTPTFVSDRITLFEYNTLAEAKAAYPSVTWVSLDPRGGVLLPSYSHPAGDTIYLLGPDSSGLALNPEEKSQAVKIPSCCEYVETWALVAANITLYDRMVKST